RPVRVGLGEGRRLRDLPVLVGDARRARLRPHPEPRPARGGGRAEGGPEARRLPAREAALDDPPREHATPAPGRRDDHLSRARIRRGRGDGRRPRRLRRRARARPARARQRAREALGPRMTLAPDAVRTMFDRIAPVYDAMNRVMTAGLDLRWRRLAASLVVRPGDRVLDAACGTGDFAVADHRAGALSVTGVDFSPRMLER